MRRAAAVVIAGVFIAGCGGPTIESIPGGTVRELTVGGQRAIVLTPPEPTRKLVLYVHGAGGTADAIREAPVTPLTAALVHAGFAVAASDAHGMENWGNAASVTDYVRLAHHLGYPDLYVLAQSAGGLDAVQLIDWLHPRAWVGIYPVCNAESVYRLGKFSGNIEEGLGAGPPPARLSPARARDARGLPVLMWASPEDKMVPKRENADECARWMRKEGAHVRVIATRGEHGDPSNFHPRRLSDFFQRH